MRIKFSKETDYIPEWNGNRDLPADQQIKCKIKPMEVGDVMLMMDAIGGSEGIREGQTRISGNNAGKFVLACKDLVPKYITITGLETEEGPISLEDLTTYAAFVPLVAEILMQCANTSVPSDAAEGNSEPRPA